MGNRLSNFIGIPGGPSMEDAVARADAGVERLHDKLVAVIDDSLDCINGYAALKRSDRAPDVVREELHRLSYNIASIAELATLAPMGEAARSLCKLLESFCDTGEWDEPAFAVHVQSLKLLHAISCPEESAKLLAGLHKVRQHLVHAESMTDAR